MASAAREYLMVVEESAYNTPAATPVIWTTATTYGLGNAAAYYCRLSEGNAFTMDVVTKQHEIMYGGGIAIPAVTVSDKADIAGTLKMELSVLQAPFWLSWAMVSMNSAQTAPWTSTEPVGDLASCSVYHAIMADNGTVKRRVFGGCKVTSIDLEANDGSTTVMLTLGLVASTPEGNFVSGSDPTSGTFPVPLETYFPVDPYLWIHSNGHLTLGGTSRTIIKSLKLSIRNSVAKIFSNSRYLVRSKYTGRTVDVDGVFQFSLSPDDRTNYEATTPESASIEFTNATHSFTINMNSTVYYKSLSQDLPLDDLYWFKTTSRPMFDVTAGSDFTLTLT